MDSWDFTTRTWKCCKTLTQTHTTKTPTAYTWHCQQSYSNFSILWLSAVTKLVFFSLLNTNFRFSLFYCFFLLAITGTNKLVCVCIEKCFIIYVYTYSLLPTSLYLSMHTHTHNYNNYYIISQFLGLHACIHAWISCMIWNFVSFYEQ